jgi:hypothetical protein
MNSIVIPILEKTSASRGLLVDRLQSVQNSISLSLDRLKSVLPTKVTRALPFRDYLAAACAFVLGLKPGAATIVSKGWPSAKFQRRISPSQLPEATVLPSGASATE